MNRIEDQWHQLKTHMIAEQMFENEFDLAMAVIKGIEAMRMIRKGQAKGISQGTVYPKQNSLKKSSELFLKSIRMRSVRLSLKNLCNTTTL